MAFQISPGINVTEIDLTTIIPAVGTTVGAIAGPFRWGPANTPVLVDSELTLVSEFGQPDNATANVWFTAANFLSYANALQVVRCIKEGSVVEVVPEDATGRLAQAQIEVDDSGTITAVDVINKGEYYVNVPTVTMAGPGSGAVITANLGTGPDADKVVSYDIVSGGNGYLIGHKNATGWRFRGMTGRSSTSRSSTS